MGPAVPIQGDILTTGDEARRGTLSEDVAGRWLPYVVIAAVAACLFAVRLAAPPNLLDKDQEHPAAYVLDVVKNGNWLCQHDLEGAVSSKPPLWTWLSALATLAHGRISV